VRSTRASDDLKRCTKCGEEKPRAEFSRDRSRKDGRVSQCKACVRRWQQENAKHLAEYHRRWQQANREKHRAHDRRYRERVRQDPDDRERRRANARRRDRERRAQDPEYVERRRENNRRYRGAKARANFRRAARGRQRLRSRLGKGESGRGRAQRSPASRLLGCERRARGTHRPRSRPRLGGSEPRADLAVSPAWRRGGRLPPSPIDALGYQPTCLGRRESLNWYGP
jgi:hypothetical protein